MERRLPLRKVRSLAIPGSAVLLLLLPASEAAPRQLNCTLTLLESTADANFSGAESRSIAITVDREAKTIAVSQDGTTQAFDHVTFSQLTINGYTSTLSLGLNTSSGNLVLQSYGPKSNQNEFGTCDLK